VRRVSSDLDDSRPLYVRVADALRDAIERGEYAVGDKLPSQAELMEQHGVSHMTVKQAIDLLKKDQTVVARQGLGLFVRGPVRRTVDAQSQIEELRSRVEKLESRVHAIEARQTRPDKR
jgi:DNA-binding GntR family transcriptional regulator